MSSEHASAVRDAFARSCAEDGTPGPGEALVLAVSGGLDSTVLLHLARFAWPAKRAPRLVVAHFDHRIRPGSRGDARWLRGLCRAWGLELVTGAAERPPGSEAEARDRRYAFLRAVGRTVGASHVATAHHADDQAETVLFRMLRGTGPAGLRGVRALREDGLWRPLLAVWRDELEGYAEAYGLGWRDDPTNERLDYARNALRHRIIPDAERLVAPAARQSLVRFAHQAAVDEEGWESLMPGLVESLGVVRNRDGIRMDRAAFLTHHPAVRARVLRWLLAELNLTPDANHTARAVAFAASGRSGRSLELGGGVRLRRELDRLALVRPPDDVLSGDRPVVIPGAGSGRAEAVLGGRAVRVAWGAGAASAVEVVERFDGDALRFPLSVRAWENGDRMRTRNGVRKLKRVFLEARIPAPERRRLAVLSDAEGEVLWIPGVARARVALVPDGQSGEDVLPIGVT